MSRISVRRLTAVIALLAVLCMAMPAAAAPVRPHAVKAPAVSLLDQFLTWIGSFLPGQVPAAKTPAEKTAIPIKPVIPNVLAPASNESDHGGMIDPNG
jgi:hypothetical protein